MNLLLCDTDHGIFHTLRASFEKHLSAYPTSQSCDLWQAPRAAVDLKADLSPRLS